MQKARELLALLAFLTTNRVSVMADVDIPIIITRKQARHQGLKRYFTGKSCKHGHIFQNYVSTGRCVRCALNIGTGEERKKYLLKNKLKIRDRNKEYYKKNKTKFTESSVKRKSTKAKEIVAQKKEYYAKNKAEYLARCRLRQSRLIQRTPAWADLKKIEKFYKDRETISNGTGVLHHVDHIIPLQGKTVSGLHVENNLQIIPAKENMSKHNNFYIENA